MGWKKKPVKLYGSDLNKKKKLRFTTVSLMATNSFSLIALAPKIVAAERKTQSPWLSLIHSTTVF